MIVYNAESTLEAAINSILAQDFQNFKLLIFDDASLDSTSDICNKYKSLDSRIYYFRHEKNIGQIKNFWYCLNHANTDYFMWAAQDDYWNNSYIKSLISILNEQPDIVLACSHVRVYDPKNNKTVKIFKPKSLNSNFRLYRYIAEHFEPCVNKYYGIYRTKILNSYPLDDLFIYDYADNLVIDYINLAGKTAIVNDMLFNYAEEPGKLRTTLDLKFKKSFSYKFFKFNHFNYLVSQYRLLKFFGITFSLSFVISIFIASIFFLKKIMYKMRF